jgi:putative oxidoreductase
MPPQVIRNAWHAISRFVQRVNAIIELIAQPSLVQFVLRIGLATPFWRSGINNGTVSCN